ARNEPLALKAAKRWQTLAPAEGDAREAVARLALRAGDRVETQAQCEALIKGHAAGPDEGFRQVAQLLSQENSRREDALAVMEQLRRLWPELAGAYYAQSLLALRFNQLDLAEHAARESLRLTGAVPPPKGGGGSGHDALLLLTGVLVKKGDLAGADRTIAELIKDNKNPAELRMGYARLLIESDRHEEARRQFEAALAAKPDYAGARYALGLMALEREEPDRAEPQFRALLESPAFKSQARYYLGRIEEARKRPLEALKWYEQVTEGDQVIDAAVHRAVLRGKLDRLQESRTLLAGMREQVPGLATRFYLAEGEILLDQGQGSEALAMYLRALNESPNDTDLLYGRSLVHERMEKT
ncbi:MAG: tetratricopeptide repeat protein, partial [Hydrocarboniphaga effusa]|nr:tetratricopeptide repeat protein [Hydrocarboniphaga effusa]